ncbi:hypothetical protein ACHWQZ_G016482 [Mnemiopsis leidyi]
MVILYQYEAARMESDAERYFWATYALFVAVSSILGDTVIIVASRNKDSFRLNKFLVTIMQHIAVCDISVSLTHVLPSAISLFADRWVLGEALCYTKPYLSYYFYPANMSLICVLTTGKFLLLRKPTRARNWSQKQAHVICGVVWTFFFVYPILMLALGKDDVSFDFRTYSCEYGWNAHTWKKIQSVMFMMSALGPNAVMIITTIPTLKFLVEARKSARRTKKSVPWQGALTVSLTAIVYFLSTMPATVYLVGGSFAGPESRFHTLYRYGIYIAMANITSNFFIYTLTITSFRRYLKSRIKEVSSSRNKFETGESSLSRPNRDKIETAQSSKGHNEPTCEEIS